MEVKEWRKKGNALENSSRKGRQMDTRWT